MQGSFLSFCSRCPSLIAALFFLLGLGFAKQLYLPLFLPLIWISLPFWKKAPQKLLIFTALFLVAFLYGKSKEPFFPSKQEFIEGQFLFIPSKITSHSSHFKKTSYVVGTIKQMNGGKIKNIPCSFPLPKNHLPIDSHFYIEGLLKKKQEGTSFFSFVPTQGKAWKPVKNTFSLSEKRFRTKNFLARKLKHLFSHPKVADFMIALSLGELDDRMLKFDFGKLGLQHILAISGFHFGLLSLLLGTLLRFILPEKIAIGILLAGLSAYFLLLGNSPSILRAYLAISLYLIGKLGRWPVNSLNIFGSVLLIELCLDPEGISHLGFQLSFLATFAILLLLPLTKSWMLAFFPFRSFEESLELRFIERWAYLLCCFLRSAFSLNIAVHLAIVPVCLFYFHKFPLISLAYNLFIPLGVSFSLTLLLISIPFLFLIPPLGNFLMQCNQSFTAEMLQLISQSPASFDVSIRANHLPLWGITLFLCLLFTLPFLRTRNRPPLLLESLPR